MDHPTHSTSLTALALECIRSHDNTSQAIDMAELMQIERSATALPTIARARWLLAQLASSRDPLLISASIDEVAGCNQWPSLLAEILSRLPPGPLVVDIVAAVVARCAVDHPLATLVGRAKQVQAAFDMIDDGQVLNLRAPDWATASTFGYLLSVDTPERDCTRVEIMRDGTHLILTPIGADDWLERERAACPPALLVADGQFDRTVVGS